LLMSLLERAGLPTRLEGSASAVLERLGSDKKNIDGALHWILPCANGVSVTTEVPLALAHAALIETGAT
jgi:3-dehydroquinate synthetase